MITDGEVETRALAYGVDVSQIRRDHLVSHILHTLPDDIDAVRFFGGTALTRSHLVASRLSEDVDLLVDDHRESAARLSEVLPVQLRSEFPGLEWSERVRTGRFISAVVSTEDVLPVQVQFVRIEPNERRLKFERREVELRYSDLPPTVSLLVPALETFAAMKMAAWQDRKTPRDLFDLAGLVRIGAVDTTAVDALRILTGIGPIRAEYERLPAGFVDAWDAELAHQTAELPRPKVCLAAVRAAVQSGGSAPD